MLEVAATVLPIAEKRRCEPAIPRLMESIPTARAQFGSVHLQPGPDLGTSRYILQLRIMVLHFTWIMALRPHLVTRLAAVESQYLHLGEVLLCLIT